MLSFFFAVSLAALTRPQMVVSTNWLADNIKTPNVVVLDVNTADQYNTGHIPGAVFLNVNLLMVRHNDIPNELPPVAELERLFRNAGVGAGDRIILTSNNPLFAARAWFTLDYLGWGDHAAILDGGNATWRAEQRKLTTRTAVPVRTGDFAAIVDPHVLISRDELKTLLESNEPAIVLDARGNPKHFVAGRIPTAACFPWTANTTSKGVLRDAEQLKQAYASLNLTSESQRVVLYCRTGTEATVNYFVLRYLGFHPVLYDGSFVEWNKTEKVVSSTR